MKKDWAISTKPDIFYNLPICYQSDVAIIYSKDELKRFLIKGREIFILIDGYILPRLRSFNQYKDFVGEELIRILFEKYEFNFIHYIKGTFILILVVNGKINVYTDRIGIKKCFYYQDDNIFIISNNLKVVTSKINAEIDGESIALLSLMHHFIDGRTIFKGIKYTLPASCIEIGDVITSKSYWDLSSLLNIERRGISFDNLAEMFVRLMESYIHYFTPGRISMTLTGGMDSRVILASLLKLGAKPYTFTFGNPLSADVTIAQNISNKYDLKHVNHYEKTPTPEWYDKLTDEIIENGDSFIHIHRAHRLYAIKQEITLHPDVDMILVGSMGGEGIRGLHYDDLIVTEFVRRVFTEKAEMQHLIRDKLTEYFLRSDSVELEHIFAILKNQRYFQNNSKKNEFYLLYELVGSLHDTQDITLFGHYVKHVVPIFMDIDFLEILFASSYSMLYKERNSKNPFKKANIPELHCNLLRIICPSLCDIPFSNGFSPREFFLGPIFYIFVRGFRKIFGNKYPPNFPYTDFFTEFSKWHFKNICENTQLNTFFDLERASISLRDGNHGIKEGYWHKFSNIIMIKKLVNHFAHN